MSQQPEPQSEQKEPEMMQTLSPPQGYVLVEQGMYDFLMAQARIVGDQDLKPKSNKQEKAIFLRVLKPYYLGDIKTQLNPHEVIEWVPRRSLTVRGKVHTDLGSFLGIWNQQYQGSSRYNPNFAPVFAVEEGSEQDLLEALPQPPRSQPRMRTEEQRIRDEEGAGTKKPKPAEQINFPPALNISTAPTPTQQQIDEVDMPLRKELIPPRGTEARRRYLHEFGMERMVEAEKRAAAKETDSNKTNEVEDIESFQVVPASQNSQQTITEGIPGPPADEAKAMKQKVKRR